MASARQIVLSLAVTIAACAGDDETGDAANGVESAQALVAEMFAEYESALTHRCECLVEQDLLYDSTDACMASLGWPASGEECLTAAFEDHGTDELKSALRCHIDDIADANACGEGLSCQELIIDGACDATAAESPCGQAAIDLFAFLYEHCPELGIQPQ